MDDGRSDIDLTNFNLDSELTNDSDITIIVAEDLPNEETNRPVTLIERLDESNTTVESGTSIETGNEPIEQDSDEASYVKPNWDIDNCLALLRTKKEMEPYFNKFYHNREAWITLCKKNKWKCDWEYVKVKFNNLRAKGVPKRLTNVRTGTAGDVQLARKKTELKDLVSYFSAKFHKTNPPGTIDTSAQSKDTQESSISSPAASTSEENNNNSIDSEPPDSARNETLDNGSENFFTDLDSSFENESITNSQTSSSSFNSSDTSASGRSFLTFKARKPKHNHLELISRSVNCMEVISSDLKKHTEVFAAYFEFIKEQAIVSRQ